jgi:hypothetical protein
LSPSRNSVSNAYMTALMASVVLRYSARQAGPGAPMNAAIVPSDSSYRAVISAAAARPCGMLPYRGASDRYSPVSSRGGDVPAALSASTRPVAGNSKCLRIARTSSSPLIVATPSRPGPRAPAVPTVGGAR